MLSEPGKPPLAYTRCVRSLLFLLALPLAAQSGWWTSQPVRWLQTNLREPDAAVDPRKLVDDAARFHANVLHINVGGIVAFYPTEVPFHHRSPALRGDLIGDVVRLAHARGIKVVGRFDLSKTPKATFDAHPEWFFRQANGEPVIFNGLYSTCINSEWYRVHAMKILTEALERYELDGLFFNMFGNQSSDYAGRFVGHCHCDSCRRLYREAHGRELPKEPDAAYRQFLFDSSRRVARAIGELIRAKRPQAGFFNYIQEHTDGIMSESNTAIGRALPLWPYASSDNVNRARNSEPTKASVNLCMEFVDFPWRWAMVSPAEIRLRLWQNVAHGGAAAFPSSPGSRPTSATSSGRKAPPACSCSTDPRAPGNRTRNPPTGACSACSARSTSPSPSRRTWTGSESATSTL